MSATASLIESNSTALVTFRVHCEDLTHCDQVSLVLRDEKVRSSLLILRHHLSGQQLDDAASNTSYQFL